MRITSRMMSDHVIGHINDNQERLRALSDKISSGKEFQNASDAPTDAAIALNLRSVLRSTEDYREVVNVAKDWMTASDFALKQLEDVGLKAQNLALRGLNDTLGAGERLNALAAEMQGLLQQGIDLGNSQHAGKYLFSGYKTDTKTFAEDPLNPGTYSYGGDANQIQYQLSPGQTVTGGLRGDQAIGGLLNAVSMAYQALASNNVTGLRTALQAIQDQTDVLEQHRTANGARMRQVDAASDYLDKVELEVKSLLSQKENVNMAEAITLYRGQETAYQSVLEVSQRAISALNLFDYLR